MEEQTDRAVKLVNMIEIYPVMKEILDQNGTFTLTVTGTSMYPTILGGRDQAVLSKPPERLSRLDVPLYRRRNGQFVLHRIVGVEENGTYTLCGDHQWTLEKGISQDQIIALATEFVRKGKRIDLAASRGYRFWSHFWCWILPLRKLVFRCYSLAARLYHATIGRLFSHRR